MEAWAFFGFLGFVLFLLWGYGDSVDAFQKHGERVREMLHKERLLAIEKGLPPPDGSFDEALLAYTSNSANGGTDPARSRRRALGWAIVLVFGGSGWTIASLFVPQESTIGWVHDTFGFGIVPVMLGLGVLLHTLLLRPRD